MCMSVGMCVCHLCTSTEGGKPGYVAHNFHIKRKPNIKILSNRDQQAQSIYVKGKRTNRFLKIHMGEKTESQIRLNVNIYKYVRTK